MAIAYSEDLRKKALDLIDRGQKIAVVSKLLKIGRSSLYLWLSQRRREGSVAPKKDWRKGYGNKIKDIEIFKKFVDDHQGLTAKEMAEKWGNISLKTICKWLHRVGYTRKKRPTVTKNGVKRKDKFIWKA